MQCSFGAHVEARTPYVIVKCFRPSSASSSIVVAALAWPICFPYAYKKSSVQRYDFCGVNIYQVAATHRRLSAQHGNSALLQ
jgi:hypothetical protein